MESIAIFFVKGLRGVGVQRFRGSGNGYTLGSAGLWNCDSGYQLNAGEFSEKNCRTLEVKENSGGISGV